jgi:hypothetical protein
MRRTADVRSLEGAGPFQTEVRGSHLFLCFRVIQLAFFKKHLQADKCMQAATLALVVRYSRVELVSRDSLHLVKHSLHLLAGFHLASCQPHLP